ncbi:MAG: BatD family protein [Planctomycetaceae bacterium]|nr:BatD family protein [Planctomycetaceae bacterium]
MQPFHSNQPGIYRFATILFLCTQGILSASLYAAVQKPELIVEIDKDSIYEGESIVYRLTLNHVENPSAPQLPESSDFQIEPLGEQSLDSHQISIINGRRSEIIRRGRQYNYRLTPLKAGTLTIPSPTANIHGEVLAGDEVTIRVIAPERQDDVILEVKSDRDVVYPMQPFRITLTILVRDLPGAFAARDPLTVQPRPPVLSVPWLNDEQIPDGLEPVESWREILEPLISQRGHGVQVNNIGTSSVFSLFNDNSTGFHPKPERTERLDSSGNNAGYWQYKLSRRFIPKQIGKFTIPASTLKGTFALEVENGQLLGEQRYVIAPAIDITVKDVPTEGRPQSYIGAVGSFEVSAKLNPVDARVGDPMTFSLTIIGQGTLDSIRPPDLDAIPEIASSFRTYEATQSTDGNSRQFTWSLRPLNQDTREFPSISVSYFDVDSEEYRTLNTPAIPVTISEAPELSSTDIVAGASNNDGTTSELMKTREGGLFANDIDVRSMKDESIHPTRWVMTWTTMICVWAASTIIIRRRKRLFADPAVLRRQGAFERARSRLDEARLQANRGEPGGARDSARRSVVTFVADHFDLPETGLTQSDIRQRLRTADIDDALQDSIQEFLNECDAARYGAASRETGPLLEQADSILNALAKGLRRSTLVLMAACCLINFIGCSSQLDAESSLRIQNIEQSFSEASTPEEFSQVAVRYQEIIETGFRSGAIFYNQGNAWMRANQRGRAVAAWRQAQRYRPRDPYLTANLQSALSGLPGNPSVFAHRGVLDDVLFWQHWLSYPEKFVATTLFLMTVLALSLLKTCQPSWKFLTPPILGSLMLLAMSAVSLANDWNNAHQIRHGVVTTEQIARKGNSETFEPAFTTPLLDGMEFTVLEQRSDWLHIQLNSATESTSTATSAWIPLKAAVLY